MLLPFLGVRHLADYIPRASLRLPWVDQQPVPFVCGFLGASARNIVDSSPFAYISIFDTPLLRVSSLSWSFQAFCFSIRRLASRVASS